MKITVNNKEHEINADLSVKDFLEKLNLTLGKTLVTISGETLSLNEFSTVLLKENDSVELFSFVGGG